MKLNYKENIDLTIGAGGRASQNLIKELMFKEFANPFLLQESDQAILPATNKRLAFSTDSYVVSPIFFNGGDIGSLSINGTINDLSVGFAKPLYISTGFIIEEGFPLESLARIVKSMASAAQKAGVIVVTGDTKVVEKGKGDGIYINTSGIGIIESETWQPLKPNIGDKVIISGSIADHGMAILAKRNGLNFATDIESDCAPMNKLVENLLPYAKYIKLMRDPTRGGVSAVLNEWADFYKLGININEESILVRENVKSLCELLGLDPLHVANEGKLMLVCDADVSEDIVAALNDNEYGKDARVIGEIVEVTKPIVSMTTAFGGQRRVDWLNGEQLPRIC